MARFSNKRLGLALGSGIARGLAHIGVLNVLHQEGISFDMMAGTSAGAAIGALFARGVDITVIEEMALSIDLKKMASLLDPILPKTGLIGGKKIIKWLGAALGKDVSFDDLAVPFACVATDITSYEEVVINEGLVLDAIRASISIPAIFAAAKWQDKYLVDGTLVNPVPVNVLKTMGADVVIAVDVVPRAEEIHQQIADKKIKKPNIFGVMIQSINVASYTLANHCVEEADIVIHPQVGHISPTDFHRGKELIAGGELAARAAMPEIKKLLSVR
ncbi:patatin-like phospholipase family protein [Chloroflexota bacterium]